MRTLLAVLLTTASFGLHAQVGAPQRPDAGQILEQMKQPAQPPPPPVAPGVLPKKPDTRPAFSAPSGLRVRVKGFRVTGNTVVSEERLQTLLADLAGKELDIQGLNEAASRVQRYYVSRGYFLAVTYLPQQEIRDGLVEIAVLEGRLGKLDLETTTSHLKERLVRGTIERNITPGELITERDLERALLLINDLPNAQVTSALRPGSEVGSADLWVRVTEAPRLVTGDVDFDNGGNRFTGENRLGATLNANNLAGWGDVLSFRGYVADEHGNNYMRLSYFLPVWYYGTRLGASYSKVNYLLGKDFESLKAHGDAGVWSAYVFHPLRRSRYSNVTATLTYDHKKLDDLVDTTSSSTETTISNFKPGIFGDVTDGILGGGFNAYAIALTTGKVDIAPSSALALDVGPTGRNTSGSFHKWNVDYRRLQQLFSRSWTLLFQFSGQYAYSNLTSAEKFSLGGPNGVRGYPVGEATADTAYIATAELRFRVPSSMPFGGELGFFGFVDTGSATINKNPLPTDTENFRNLSSYGIGATFGKEGSYFIKGSFAWNPAGHPPQSDTAVRVPRGWIQALKYF